MNDPRPRFRIGSLMLVIAGVGAELAFMKVAPGFAAALGIPVAMGILGVATMLAVEGLRERGRGGSAMAGIAPLLLVVVSVGAIASVVVYTAYRPAKPGAPAIAKDRGSSGPFTTLSLAAVAIAAPLALTFVYWRFRPSREEGAPPFRGSDLS